MKETEKKEEMKGPFTCKGLNEDSYKIPIYSVIIHI